MWIEFCTKLALAAYSYTIAGYQREKKIKYGVSYFEDESNPHNLACAWADFLMKALSDFDNDMASKIPGMTVTKLLPVLAPSLAVCYL